jgi:ParB family chromosome partitioning protein
MTIYDIPIEEIDLEGPDFDEFLFSYRPAIEGLAASIKKVGLIHPVLLLRLENQAKFRLISGYRRVLAYRKIGKPSVAARILAEKEISKEEALLLSLHENIHSRGLHDIEKAMALKKFQLALRWSEDRLCTDLAPLLNIPPSLDFLTGYLSLNCLLEEIRSLFYEEKLTLGQALLLARLSEAEQRTLCHLVLKRCLLNLNELKEVIRNLTDLRDLRGSSFEKILADESFPSPFREMQATPRQRAQAIRSGLRFLRYPRVCQKENALGQAVRSLHLGNEVSFRPAPFFEADDLRIQIVAKNAAHLREILQKMNKGLEEGKVQEIFRIIRE